MVDLVLEMIGKVFRKDTASSQNYTSPLLKMIYPVKTLHIIPGRVRFSIPAIKSKEDSCKLLREQLIKINAVTHVDVNPITASATINYNVEKIEPEILFAAIIKILDLEEELEKKPDPKFSKEMRFFCRSLNKSIYNQTNGLLDFQNVISIFFSLGAAMQLLRGQTGLPSALTLFWWAFYPSLRDTE